MKRAVWVVALALALGASSSGISKASQPEAWAADAASSLRDGNGKVDKCKPGKKGCDSLKAPEIDPAGALVPTVLIAGALLLLAEGVRRAR